MSFNLFEALKTYVGLTAEDEVVLRELYPRLKLHFRAIVEDFYDQINLHEPTRRILEGPEQIERLKGSLEEWLGDVFLGPHDDAYVEKRTKIGLTHVRVGLPQVYVFAAMSHIERHLAKAVVEEIEDNPGGVCQALGAITKIINLDLALIAGSYHEAEKYRDMVEHSPDMIHQVDREGRLVTVNRTEEKRLGYRPGELLGRKLEDLVPESKLSALRDHLDRVFETGESRCELQLLTSSGSAIDVEILATGVGDPLTGKIIRSRASVREIGDRKRAEEALRRERDAVQRYLDIAGAIICLIDVDGRFQLMNKMGCDLIGRPESEILGRHLIEFVPEKAAGAVIGTLGDLVKGDFSGHSRWEAPFMSNFEAERIIEWQSTPIRNENGHIAGILSSGVDITERRRMEKALIEQASLARLGEMAAVVAHEVKNPLAGISGALQVIAQRLTGESADRSIITEILSRLDALNETVNDILLFARPRAPRRNPVPILTVIQDTLAVLLQDKKLEGILVETSGQDLVVSADAELLKSVFLNILLNAAQALGGKGRISIEVLAGKRDCSVAISDDGPGIPPAVREKVFEPFFSTKHRGTGLGLAITKRLLVAQGGSIEIECPAGGGTTVIIHLPLRT